MDRASLRTLQQSFAGLGDRFFPRVIKKFLLFQTRANVLSELAKVKFSYSLGVKSNKSRRQVRNLFSLILFFFQAKRGMRESRAFFFFFRFRAIYV